MQCMPDAQGEPSARGKLLVWHWLPLLPKDINRFNDRQSAFPERQARSGLV